MNIGTAIGSAANGLEQFAQKGLGVYGNFLNIKDTFKNNDYERERELAQLEYEKMTAQGEAQAKQNAFLSQIQLTDSVKKIIAITLIGIGALGILFAILPKRKGRKK